MSTFMEIFDLPEKHGLHILVNNAGVMCHPRAETKEGHELHFGVNYLGMLN